MKAAGAQRVVSMLSDSELATYAEPLAAALTAAFGEGKWINVDGKASGAQLQLQPQVQQLPLLLLRSAAPTGWRTWREVCQPGRLLAPCTVCAVFAGTAPTVIAALRAARDAGETALVYCWGGGGRTGVVQAAWLVLEHGMSEADAAAAVVGHATGSGLSRRVDAVALSDFVAEARTAAA